MNDLYCRPKIINLGQSGKEVINLIVVVKLKVILDKVQKISRFLSLEEVKVVGVVVMDVFFFVKYVPFW